MSGKIIYTFVYTSTFFLDISWLWYDASFSHNVNSFTVNVVDFWKFKIKDVLKKIVM